MKEQREIVLPPHLFDRIRASAGEHGGIGGGKLFSELTTGVPFCAHGHAWGTCTRYRAENPDKWDRLVCQEPSLIPFISAGQNDCALSGLGLGTEVRIPFQRWCELLNVKRGVEVAKEVIVERETVAV